MRINYKSIILRIIEKYDTRDAFARALGITPGNLSLKLKGERDLKHDEIVKWCELLDISIDEITCYFFT